MELKGKDPQRQPLTWDEAPADEVAALGDDGLPGLNYLLYPPEARIDGIGTPPSKYVDPIWTQRKAAAPEARDAAGKLARQSLEALIDSAFGDDRP